MRILITAIQLTGIGGIESSLVNLLSNISDKYEIDLCVVGNYISKKTNIPANVRIVKGSKFMEYVCADYKVRKKDFKLFEKPFVIASKMLRHKIGMKRIVEIAFRNFKIPGEYDVAISFVNDTHRFNSYMGGAEYVVLNCVKAKQKVAWIHNDANRLGFTYENSYGNYSKFDKLVNVSYACKNIFDSKFPEFKGKSFVVYNMFNDKKISELAKEASPYENNEKFKIITVARLDNEQKRIDKAMDCCNMLKESGYSNFEWHIAGDGPDKEMLLNMAEERGISDVLIFDGYQSNPYKFIKNADVLVMTSDYEAYSMVLTEALSLCTPIICTNYNSAAEIVKDGVNGYLAGLTATDIFEKLKKVVDNPEILSDFRANIKKQGVSNETVVSQLKELIC